MIIATMGKIVVTAQQQDNLPEWMTAGKDYILEFDGLGGCDILGDDGVLHKCETVKHVLHLPEEQVKEQK